MPIFKFEDLAFSILAIFHCITIAIYPIASYITITGSCYAAITTIHAAHFVPWMYGFTGR